MCTLSFGPDRARFAGLSYYGLCVAFASLLGLCAGPDVDAAGASVANNRPVAGTEANPYSPANHHPYRRGVMPTIAVRAAMRRWQQAHPLAANPKTLAFGGGVGGIGVNSGARSKVYLVFYGTQWGTSSTDGNGNLQFTGDTAGAAGAAQQMFKGIGTNGEKWSAELTQWCDGTGVATGTTVCPGSGASYIPFQQNVLAGVWYDNSAASPAAATAVQLANEAVAAAAHFGNTTTASNRNTYYVILSPTGTNPDHYQGSFCAWHGDTAGSGVSSPYGDLAYGNQPYHLDEGAECGQNFVNSGSAGTLDGYTITLGQQWQAMMADMLPSGGWTNQGTGPHAGQENSEECEWIAPGSPGGAANVKFKTGSFAEQSSWSNDTNDCAMTHTIANRNQPPTADFSFSTSGLKATFTDASTDSDGYVASHAWDFGDFGTSTLANPSHIYAASCEFPVTETVTDNNGLTGSETSFVSVQGTASELLCNTSFEIPASFPGIAWYGQQVDICPTGCAGDSAHSGSGFARLNQGRNHDYIYQSLTIPAGKAKATLTYWLHVDTNQTSFSKLDKLTVAVYNAQGNWIKDIQVYSNLDAGAGYKAHSNDISTYVGQQGISIRFTCTESVAEMTNFALDDVTVTVQ